MSEPRKVTPTDSCDWVDSRLESYSGGELSADESMVIESHLASCPECQSTATAAAALRRALNNLPQHRCPSLVVERAELAAGADVVSVRPPRRSRRVAIVGAAIAAGLAIVMIRPANPPEPEADPTAVTRAELADARRALAALRETAEPRVAELRDKTLRRALLNPTRKVFAAVSDSGLGRWGAETTGLFAPADPSLDDEALPPAENRES